MTTVRDVLVANAPQYVPAYDAGYPVGFQALQYVAPEFLALCPCGRARWSKVKLAPFMRIEEDLPTQGDLTMQTTRKGQAEAIPLPDGVDLSFELLMNWFRRKTINEDKRLLCLVLKMSIHAEHSSPIWLYLPVREVDL